MCFLDWAETFHKTVCMGHVKAHVTTNHSTETGCGQEAVPIATEGENFLMYWPWWVDHNLAKAIHIYEQQATQMLWIPPLRGFQEKMQNSSGWWCCWGFKVSIGGLIWLKKTLWLPYSFFLSFFHPLIHSSPYNDNLKKLHSSHYQCPWPPSAHSKGLLLSSHEIPGISI